VKWLNQLVVEIRNKEGETHHDCWTGRDATAVTFGDFAERSCENRSFSRRKGASRNRQLNPATRTVPATAIGNWSSGWCGPNLLKNGFGQLISLRCSTRRRIERLPRRCKPVMPIVAIRTTVRSQAKSCLKHGIPPTSLS
jgi:hypothetical protein